ncbi:MAG: PTS sugar transporter subunit IIC [Candidatus Eisenbacteria sp.]|nr:PTS sugar transporter subunit IIC [Candidatus Eisenbacteria bacterium]
MREQNRGAVRCKAPVAASLLLLLLAAACILFLLIATGICPPWIGAAGGMQAGYVAFTPGGILRLLMLSAWIMLVAMDERALGPLVFHEPIVAAPVAGALLGAFPEGLLIGLVLQALWPGLLPLGGSRQPVVGTASVIGVCWICLLPEGLGPWGPVVALGVTLAAAGWGNEAESVLRRRNEASAAWLQAGTRASRDAMLRAHLTRGLLESGWLGSIALVAFVGLPLLIVALITAVSDGAAARAASAPPVDYGFPDAMVWGVGSGLRLSLLFAMGGLIGRQLRKPLRAIGQRVRGSCDAWGPWWGTRERSRTERGLPAETRKALREEPAEAEREMSAPALTWRRLLGLLGLQAGFSDRQLQREGFLLAVRGIPGKRLSELGRRETTALEERMLQEGTLNTQPVMAAALIGALDRILIEAERKPLPRSPLKLLEVGGAVLAQWGDRALWGGLRPGMALLALALLPIAPAPVVVAFLTLGLSMQLGGRVVLYHWGWRAGWNVVRGSGASFWRCGPAWLQEALLPLAVGVVGSYGVAWFAEAGAVEVGLPTLFNQSMVWFMLGMPIGLWVGNRPMKWGCLCWAAAALGVLTEQWIGRLS